MDWLYARKKMDWILKKRLRIYNKKHYAGQPILSMQEINRIIAEKLNQDKPFCLLRFGYSECRFIENQLIKSSRRRKWRWKHVKRVKNIGSYFHTFEECERYVQMVLKHCKEADIMAYWPELEMEDYVLEKYASQSVLIEAKYLEPIYLESFESQSPWTYSLRGKKVLIISPFVEEIETQYQRIELVFPENNPWPDMELKTLKSVWYPGKDFANWFDALDFLYNSAMKIDFDVALLSCGPFGFDLAARFKEAGKQAIHIGGALQMMFGIMGKRWENHVEYNMHVNEYWIRASKKEKPSIAEQLDEGCYW